jgi:hypothetical protein
MDAPALSALDAAASCDEAAAVCVKTYKLDTLDGMMDAKVLSMDGTEIMLRSVWQSGA